MKKALVIIIVLVLAVVGAWFFLSGDDGEQENAQHQPQDFPERLGDAEPTASMTQHQSSLSGLMFEYPNNWNVTEGADNTEDAQLLTVESPLDINEFYFCLDMNTVSSADPSDFTIADAQVQAVETLDSGQQSVIYSVVGLNGLQWGVADEAPQVGDEGFTSEIVGDSGDRMQVFGRFNCREEAQPDLTLEEFQNARWFQEAKGIVNTLDF